MIKLECGDIIKMKKKHPCGSDEWEVIKVGAHAGCVVACVYIFCSENF